MGRGCFRERRTGFQGASNVLVHKLGSGYLGVCFLFFKLYVHILYTFCMHNIFHNLNILNGLDRPEGPPSNSLILKFHKTQSVWKLENQQNDMPESQSLRSGYVLSYHLALSFYKWGHELQGGEVTFSKSHSTWVVDWEHAKQSVPRSTLGLCANPPLGIIFIVSIQSGSAQSSSNFSYSVPSSNRLTAFLWN